MTARHHHYISQCYLKGFTEGRTKKSKLTVIDLNEKKKFETIPRNVGGIRDFNRIDIEGVDQNAIESSLSEFEGNVACALNDLEENLVFSGNTKAYILNLIALVGVRSPQQREHIGDFEATVIERTMGLMLSSKEQWEAQEAKIKAKNPTYKNDITYEEFKAFYDSKEYDIEFSNQHKIYREMVMFEAVLPCLFARNWILVKASDKTGPLITTDHPVSLSWNEPEKIPPVYRASPGFGMKDTQVYFPVSQSLGLLGEFDGDDSVVEASSSLVAILNATMLNNLYRQIYSPSIEFEFLTDSGASIDGEELLREIIKETAGNEGE